MTSVIPPRTYEDAVTALNTLQSDSAVLNASANAEMIESVRQLGYQPSDFNKLNIIHVAGTYGRGSTCAITAAILAQYKPLRSQVNKIGWYTSPHLRAVRERIQLDGSSLSEILFAKYFFEVWDRLEASALKEGRDPTVKPIYFRFLTLVAFHTYLREKVDTAIFEVGIGGEYDSTNVIQKPTVVGITSLGIDPTGVLGNTIEESAWHKTGIIKASARTFTVPQEPSAMEVIQKRASEKGSEVKVVDVYPQIWSREVKFSLPAQLMMGDASQAVALAAEHLTLLDMNPGIYDDGKFLDGRLPERFVKGLVEVYWPGRYQVFTTKSIDWRYSIEWWVDCAHTEESLYTCGSWFGARADGIINRVLIFNNEGPNSEALIVALANGLKELLGVNTRIFNDAVFCTNTASTDKHHKADLMNSGTDPEALKSLTAQHQLAQTWFKEVYCGSKLHVVPTVDEAISVVTRMTSEYPVQVLVTGSLTLVGAFLEVLGQDYPHVIKSPTSQNYYY